MLFNEKQSKDLLELMAIAMRNLEFNDKRVANALHKALEIFAEACAQKNEGSLNARKKEFNTKTNWDYFNFSDELLIAYHNTAQHQRGLEGIKLLVELDLMSEKNVIPDKAEFLAALGRQAEAEDLIKNQLKNIPNDTWLYIILGDIYYLYPVLKIEKDFEKAEFWYYQAYDRKIGIRDSKSWRDLLERLGSVTVERLRFEAEKNLLPKLSQNEGEGWRILNQFKENVYLRGSDSVILNHIQLTALEQDEKIEDINNDLQLINNLYNLLPQKSLDELCPFEMVAYMPKGEDESRIMSEMWKEFKVKLGGNKPLEERSVIDNQAFSDFQIKFFDQVDLQTGEKRNKIIKRNRKKIQRDYEKGKIVWEGFTEYRIHK